MANKDKSEITAEKASLAWSAITASHKIAIISHRNPDPDCIGSNLTIREILSTLGKQVDSYCIDPPPKSCSFLKNVNTFKQELNPEKHDLIISVDCGGTDQLGFSALQSAITTPFINIDHHPSNNNFGTINLVFPELSSTSEIIFKLLQFWENKQITPSIATNLLIGLYYDTGSFMHSNVNPEIMNIAHRLMQAGADLENIHRHLFQNFNEEKFHAWGETMENIHLTQHGTAIAVIEKDKKCNSSDKENFSGLIDYVSMAKDSQFAVMITQDKYKQIRGSLRTRNNNINLSKMAAELGGGGHRKASGFTIPGTIKKNTIWTITNH